MAITTKVQPKAFTPAYNEMVFVFDSNNKTEENFTYVIDLLVNNTNVYRARISSNPQGVGIIDVSKHVQSFVTSDYTRTTTQVFKLIPNSVASYQLDVSESYLISDNFNLITANGSGKLVFQFSTLKNDFNVGDFVDIQTGTAFYNGSQEITDIGTFNGNPIITTSKNFNNDAPFGITGTAKPASGLPFIDTANKVTTTLKKAVNAVFDFNDFINFNEEGFFMHTSSPGKFLSNIPSEFITDLDDRVSLNYCFKDINPNDELQASFLKIVSNLGTFYKQNNVIPSFTEDRQFASVYVGGYNMANGGTTSGSGVNAIDSTTKEYEVSLVNENFVQTSEIIKFKVIKNCYNYDGYRLLYLNKFGSFTSFNFSLSHEKSISVNKKRFSKNYGSYNVAINTYGYSLDDVGTSVIDIDKKEVYRINSDYVSEAVGNTIQDLIESPEVYVLDNNGARRAVDIKTSSTKIKDKKVDKLINYSIIFEYSTKNNSQV